MRKHTSRATNVELACCRLFPVRVEAGSQNGAHRERTEDDDQNDIPHLGEIEEFRNRDEADECEKNLAESKEDPKPAKPRIFSGVDDAVLTEREYSNRKNECNTVEHDALRVV